MRVSTLAFLSLLSFAQAWLPAEKDLFGRHVDVPAAKGRTVKRWLPGSGKIRGVNLGSMFIMEPWMASTEWSNMGCGSAQSEFDCVSALGQDAADSAFQSHWNTWITEDDLNKMMDLGLNTIRIPVGYWIDESLVDAASEHFPKGGLTYLERLCGWASDRGFYIIMDLHGAPGAQVPQNAFTGQWAPSSGFYDDYNFGRAYTFMTWMTNLIHSNNAYRNVGMLELVNEPEGGHSNLVSTYYPTAWSKIRAEEDSLGVASNNRLHIQMMDNNWGAGDPKSNLPDQTFAAYDYHRYVKWDTSVGLSHDAYIAASCSDNMGSDGDTPVIIGEWSLSVADSVESSDDWSPNNSANNGFYQDWFAAQVQAYEKQLGWVFWSWKAQLGDWRWSYVDAANAGIISSDLDSVASQSVC